VFFVKRRFFLFVAFLLFVLGITAHAASMAYDANPSLSFSGTTAYCSVICRGDKTTDSISATLTLYQGSTEIDSWSNSGSFCVPVFGSCGVVSGVTYRLKLTWSVNGVSQPDIEVTNTCQ
jgi:hypothetical protein